MRLQGANTKIFNLFNNIITQTRMNYRPQKESSCTTVYDIKHNPVTGKITVKNKKISDRCQPNPGRGDIIIENKKISDQCQLTPVGVTLF